MKRYPGLSQTALPRCLPQSPLAATLPSPYEVVSSRNNLSSRRPYCTPLVNTLLGFLPSLSATKLPDHIPWHSTVKRLSCADGGQEARGKRRRRSIHRDLGSAARRCHADQTLSPRRVRAPIQFLRRQCAPSPKAERRTRRGMRHRRVGNEMQPSYALTNAPRRV